MFSSVFELVEFMARRLKVFTYNSLMFNIYQYLRDNGIKMKVKRSTVERSVRKLRELGKVYDCDIVGRNKIVFCYSEKKDEQWVVA